MWADPNFKSKVVAVWNKCGCTTIKIRIQPNYAKTEMFAGKVNFSLRAYLWMHKWTRDFHVIQYTMKSAAMTTTLFFLWSNRELAVKSDVSKCQFLPDLEGLLKKKLYKCLGESFQFCLWGSSAFSIYKERISPHSGKVTFLLPIVPPAGSIAVKWGRTFSARLSAEEGLWSFTTMPLESAAALAWKCCPWGNIASTTGGACKDCWSYSSGPYGIYYRIVSANVADTEAWYSFWRLATFRIWQV